MHSRPRKTAAERLNDSKKLTAKRREEIAEELKADCACVFAVGQVEAEEIDRINILEATRKAMRLAIEELDPRADFLLIDAVQLKTSRSRKKRSSRGIRSLRQ